jgi:hypothetical protein
MEHKIELFHFLVSVPVPVPFLLPYFSSHTATAVENSGFLWAGNVEGEKGCCEQPMAKAKDSLLKPLLSRNLQMYFERKYQT